MLLKVVCLLLLLLDYSTVPDILRDLLCIAIFVLAVVTIFRYKVFEALWLSTTAELPRSVFVAIITFSMLQRSCKVAYG